MSELALHDEPAIGFFERHLTWWVAGCIVAGIALGQWQPQLFQALAGFKLFEVNLAVALLIWAMIVPMLIKVDLGAMSEVARHGRGIGVTLAVNWLLKPFSMALLAALFVKGVLAPWLPAAQLDSYVAGLILLAAAPCTAMVFVWSALCRGDGKFTLSQVALNDVIMLFAFAPLVGLLLGVSRIAVPWGTLLTSVLLFIVVPLLLAQALRRGLLARGGEAGLSATMARIQPLGMGALLTTLVLLFAFQGPQILAQPAVIALLALPILIQVYFNAGVAYWLCRRLGVAYEAAGPAALIGASNFFELAVATAIALFGLDSGAALATVVGVLVEVPVMLSVVAIVRRSRGWYLAGR